MKYCHRKIFVSAMRGRKTQRFAGDTRMYLLSTEPGGQHTRAHCQESKTIDGDTHMCTFSMRTDKLKDSLRKGNLHTCSFKRIEDIRRMFQSTQTKKKKANLKSKNLHSVSECHSISQTHQQKENQCPKSLTFQIIWK